MAPLATTASAQEYKAQHVGSLANFAAIDSLEDAIAAKLQERGRWGPMELYLRVKGRNEYGRLVFIHGLSRAMGIDVPKTEAAAAAQAASATSGAAPIDPIAAAKTIVEVGKAVTPPAPTKSFAEELASLKQAGLLSEGSNVEKWIPIVTLMLKELWPPAPPPQASFLEQLAALKASGLFQQPSLAEQIAAMKASTKPVMKERRDVIVRPSSRRNESSRANAPGSAAARSVARMRPRSVITAAPSELRSTMILVDKSGTPRPLTNGALPLHLHVPGREGLKGLGRPRRGREVA